MELVANKSGSITIGGTNSTIVVDPQDAGEKGDVVLFVDMENSLIENNFGESIIIAGAGEYEVGDFVIRGEGTEYGVNYVIECNGEKLLLLNARDIEGLSSDTRFGTVVIRLDGQYDEGASTTLPGELILLYGAKGDVTPPKVESMDKIGKRKKSELAGKTILLSR